MPEGGGKKPDAEEKKTLSAEPRQTTRTQSSIRKISPLGMRVVVRIRRDIDRTETGLYLPEGARQSMQDSLVGEVLEVARALDSDTEEEANISGIPEGSLVLIPKNCGVKIPWDDELRIVETKEVLALVTEVQIS